MWGLLPAPTHSQLAASWALAASSSCRESAQGATDRVPGGSLDRHPKCWNGRGLPASQPGTQGFSHLSCCRPWERDLGAARSFGCPHPHSLTSERAEAASPLPPSTLCEWLFSPLLLWSREVCCSVSLLHRQQGGREGGDRQTHTGGGQEEAVLPAPQHPAPSVSSGVPSWGVPVQ